MTQAKAEPQSQPGVARRRGWGSPLALAVLVFAGSFKGNPLLAWLPFDLTGAGAALLLLLCVKALPSATKGMHISPWFIVIAVVVWAAFVPPAGNPYAASARVGIYLVILAGCGARLLVYTDARARRAWVWLCIIAGLLVCLLAQISTEVATDRVAAEGSNSIATSQGGGMAVVGLASLLLSGALKSWLLRGMAVVGVLAGFATMLQTGSRGPLVATAVALVVVALAGGHVHTKALKAITVGGALWVGYSFLISATSAGAERLQNAFSGDIDNTETRRPLWDLALASVADTPFGLGWGNFYQVGRTSLSGERLYPHNIVLEVASEGGWLAGVLVIGILGLSLFRLVRGAADGTEAALLGLTVLAVGTAMVSGNLGDQRLLCVLVVLGLVGRRDPDSETDRPDRGRPATAAMRRHSRGRQ